MRILPVRGIAIQTPCFFASVSSVKANLSICEYVAVLLASGYPHFLLSAYDIDQLDADESGKLRRLLNAAREQNQFCLLDSGNYESFWLKAGSTWIKPKFLEIISQSQIDLCLTFDGHPRHARFQDQTKEILEDLSGIAGLNSNLAIVPIVHAAPEYITEAVVDVASRCESSMIAVAERELGDSIIQRAETVRRIRTRLKAVGFDHLLHLLGTGNPLSILIYVAAGADSFDGLEWSQTVVDARNATLHHFAQRSMYPDHCAFCEIDDLPYSHVTLLHNLCFFRSWMEAIQAACKAGNINDELDRWLPKDFVAHLRRQLATQGLEQ